MTGRPAREIVREGALLRVGWTLARPLAGLYVLAHVMAIAGVIVLTSAVALAGLWLWIVVPHGALAGIMWATGVALAALALPVRSPRACTMLALAAGLFIAAAISIALGG